MGRDRLIGPAHTLPLRRPFFWLANKLSRAETHIGLVSRGSVSVSNTEGVIRMLALQKLRGLLVGAALMCAPLAASAVPMTTGSTFTSGLVDYDIVSNVGFGTDATLQPASNGFDMTPDLTAFSFFAPSQAAGELILNATGQDFGSLVTVINDLLLQMTGTYTASAPGGYNISATLDITGSLFGTPSCTAPGPTEVTVSATRRTPTASAARRNASAAWPAST